MNYQNDDLRIKEIKELLPPVALLEKFPATDRAAQTVSHARQAIHQILQGKDDRLLVVLPDVAGLVLVPVLLILLLSTLFGGRFSFAPPAAAPALAAWFAVPLLLLLSAASTAPLLSVIAAVKKIKANFFIIMLPLINEEALSPEVQFRVKKSLTK